LSDSIAQNRAVERGKLKVEQRQKGCRTSKKTAIYIKSFLLRSTLYFLLSKKEI